MVAATLCRAWLPLLHQSASFPVLPSSVSSFAHPLTTSVVVGFFLPCSFLSSYGYGGEEALILASLASFSRSRPDVCNRFPVLSFTGDPTVLEPSDLSPSFAPLHMLSLCLAFYSPCLADKLISSSKCCSNVSSPITFPLISPLSLVETPSVSWLYVLQGLGLYIFVHHCIPILWHSI